MYYASTEWTFTNIGKSKNFELKNLEKPKAIQRKQWGADNLPDFIKCWSPTDNKDIIRIPPWIRGFFPHISKDLPTIPANIPNIINKIPYDYQEEAVNSLLNNPTGLLHASTGSGKTIMACMIANRLQQKTLIVVKDVTLLSQMVADIKDNLGLIVDYTGWTKSKKYSKTVNTLAIHVTTIQSVEKVNEKDYSVIILDEVHTMLGSDKRREFVGSLTAKHIYWLTGTPIINDVEDRVFPMCLWPTTKCEVINMTPEYHMYMTQFEYDLDNIKDFYLLKAALYEDIERNHAILSTISHTLSNGKWVVFTDYIEHAKTLAQWLTSMWIKTFVLIWEVSKDERDAIKKEAKEYNWPCIIIGSVQIIGTGFDMPELSRAYLTTTTRFKWDLLQYIGRIIRKHPTKQAPIFIDFADVNQPLLNSQSMSRQKAYKQNFPQGKVKYITLNY